jgi:hypothetical protein
VTGREKPWDLANIPELHEILRRGLLSKVRIFEGWCENGDRPLQVIKVNGRPLALARSMLRIGGSRPGEGGSETMTGALVKTSLPLAALELAAQGWDVLPCKWCGDNAEARLLPPPGHHLATRDPEQIRARWRRWPHAMIGARVPDSMLVVDLDPRKTRTVSPTSRRSPGHSQSPTPRGLVVTMGGGICTS